MKAADFSLLDQDGNRRSLADYKGKWLVVYFYPRDDTPGCTKEACSFRDSWDEFEKRGVEVVGISGDTPESHKKFAEKYQLPFTLLSDPERTVIDAYGALGEKKMFNNTFMGILRKTVIVSPEGEAVKEYPKVTPAGHAGKILKDLEGLK